MDGGPIITASSRAMIARVGKFTSVINHLAFSPDGRWPAASSSQNVGLRVINTRSWRIIAEDKTYADDSYGAAFGPDGRLYTVAYDGKIRCLIRRSLPRSVYSAKAIIYEFRMMPWVELRQEWSCLSDENYATNLRRGDGIS